MENSNTICSISIVLGVSGISLLLGSSSFTTLFSSCFNFSCNFSCDLFKPLGTLSRNAPRLLLSHFHSDYTANQRKGVFCHFFYKSTAVSICAEVSNLKLGFICKIQSLAKVIEVLLWGRRCNGVQFLFRCNVTECCPHLGMLRESPFILLTLKQLKIL